MFAEHLSRQFGTLNHFVIISYGNAYADTGNLAQSLADHFPDLHYSIQPFRLLADDPAALPPSDMAVCTLWTTAYLQVRYNQTRAKFYLVQDYEPAFYAASDVSGVIEATYRFGFAVLANTQGVAERIRNYSADVTQFGPGVDRRTFYPDADRQAPNKRPKIVFYGRPSNPRNCFVTGLETLKAVKHRLGDEVDIISVGAEWDESEFGVEGVVRNLGLLKTMKDVADLYRSADFGLVYMMTPHPSYQPFEYMASGCVVVTNQNEANSWLLNSSNALLIPPLPALAAAEIVQLSKDTQRWQRMRDNGLKTVAPLDWRPALLSVEKRICC